MNYWGAGYKPAPANGKNIQQAGWAAPTKKTGFRVKHGMTNI